MIVTLSIFKNLFSNLPDNAMIIKSVNNPVQLPKGGKVELQKRFIKDERGEIFAIGVSRLILDREYIVYCELPEG